MNDDKILTSIKVNKTIENLKLFIGKIMPTRLTNIESGTTVAYDGDVVVTGSIGDNVRLVVNGGLLTIGGDVGSATKISLSSESSESANVGGINLSITGSSNSIVSISTGNTSGGKVVVNGDVGSGVVIETTNGAIHAGNVGGGSTLKTGAGAIKVGNVDGGSTLATGAGAIKAGNVGGGSTLKTGAGAIHAGNVGENSTLATGAGAIKVGNVGENSTLTTEGGNINAAEVAARAIVRTYDGCVHVLSSDNSARIIDTSVEINGEPRSGTSAFFSSAPSAGAGGGYSSTNSYTLNMRNVQGSVTFGAVSFTSFTRK